MLSRFVVTLTVAIALLVLSCTSEDATGTNPDNTGPPGNSATTASPQATSDPIAPEGSPRSVGGTFQPTGMLRIPRSLHTATLLPDGRVLIAGGSSVTEGLLTSAELYDPATGTFAGTGALNEARQTHSAARLADGRVLITGGVREGGAAGMLASAEIYDPATGVFEHAGEMTTARLAHGSILLQDGRVLIIGGFGNPYLRSTEFYDPSTGTFTPSGDMNVGRQFPSLVPLADGRVLVHSADGPPEIYDPASGSSMLVLVNAETDWPAVAIGLLDGTVLLTGDCCGPNLEALPRAAIYDPTNDQFTEIAPMITGRIAHQMALLTDGRVLLAGGLGAATEGDERLRSAEIFDPETRTFESTADMSDPRQWHTLTMLEDGPVLLVGTIGVPFERSAEVYVP